MNIYIKIYTTAHKSKTYTDKYKLEKSIVDARKVYIYICICTAICIDIYRERELKLLIEKDLETEDLLA